MRSKTSLVWLRLCRALFIRGSIFSPPILTRDWIDRLAPCAWAVVAAGTCFAYGGIHAIEGKKSSAGIPIV